MTLSKGNGEGETSGQDRHHTSTEIREIVDKGVENIAVRAAARIALLLIVPLLGVVISNVLRDFEDRLDEIAKTQIEQREYFDKRLDVQEESLRQVDDSIDKTDKDLQLQLRTIEEILRNTQSWLENELLPEVPTFKKDLGGAEPKDARNIPVRSHP